MMEMKQKPTSKELKLNVDERSIETIEPIYGECAHCGNVLKSHEGPSLCDDCLARIDGPRELGIND